MNRRVTQAILGAVAIGAGGMLAVVTGPPRSVLDAPAFPPPMAPTVERLLPSLEPTPIEEEVDRPSPPPAFAPGPGIAEPDLGSFAEPLRDGQVITGATHHRLILFTFDDGPDLRNTPALLDTLDELGIHAVFFMTASRIRDGGPWQERNQVLAREIVRRGHIVGNHTVDHAQLPLLDDAEVLAQVQGADAIFTRVLGQRAWLVRPPGGARSARVDQLLAEHGYTQMLWNLGTGDFQVRDAEAVHRIFRRVLSRQERDAGEAGGIILLHDTHEWSVTAVPMIVSFLRDQNCGLLEQGEELYDIVDDPRLFFVPRDPADPSAVAPPADPDAEVIAERQARLRDETRQRCLRVASR